MIGQGSLLNGRYRLDRWVGRGAFAQVFLGADLLLGRRIAIKVLHPELTAGEDDYLARSFAELEHPHILAVYGYAEAEGTPE